MGQKLAVAVIHGMGSQGRRPPQSYELSFSTQLYWGLRQILGDEVFENVVWREVFWADILQRRQEDYQRHLIEQEGARWPKSRSFVMNRLTDAAAYRRDEDGSRTYRRIHCRIARTLRELERLTDGDTPLLVLAHSLGGHIMSNYIYDIAHKQAMFTPKSSFQAGETLTHFVTFGCNIPIFTFNQPRQKVTPISNPGLRVAPDAGRKVAPWWININDRDDVLGMPLAPSAPAYQGMVDRGELKEDWIRVLPAGLGRLPFAHNLYWRDKGFQHRIAHTLNDARNTRILPEIMGDQMMPSAALMVA
ncbi:hypothetical protein GG681_03025 [Epibacterium sp. SM1969]|uniref:Alpha/beta hydrolase family protein n=1 Tax=Tritonibacter aquimaris TaxID=2663379 RepID=A0A844AJP0_9RHOB|nr:hypothetical protein [Tritonibacter aquimaris]MQY41600.1 hypothetical protein [Tritonibacter aquimaris]